MNWFQSGATILGFAQLFRDKRDVRLSEVYVSLDMQYKLYTSVL